jgi:hypothetical protein
MTEVHVALFAALASAVIGLVSIVLNAYQAILIAHLRSKDSRRNVVHKQQFETEFQFYRKLWTKLNVIEDSIIDEDTKNLYEHPGGRTKMNPEASLLLDKIEFLESWLEKHRPFIAKLVYTHAKISIIRLSDVLKNIGTPVADTNREVDMDAYIESKRDLNGVIRDRIESMKA